MAKDRIFNIRVEESEYYKLKSLGSNRAREILLATVENQIFEREPESQMEKLIFRYDWLNSSLRNLKDKQDNLIRKALSKLSDDKYENAVLNNFDNFIDNIRRILANLNKERFELVKLRQEGVRYTYSGIKELARKHRLEYLDLTDSELYNELAHRNLIDNKEKYKKNINKTIREIQNKIGEQEELYNSLRDMLPYIIMRENVASEIDKVKEEMMDLLYVIEHLEALEQTYVKNFFDSIKQSNMGDHDAAHALLDNKDYIKAYYNSDLSLYDKFEKYLMCCGVGEQRAKAIRKKYVP